MAIQKFELNLSGRCAHLQAQIFDSNSFSAIAKVAKDGKLRYVGPQKAGRREVLE